MSDTFRASLYTPLDIADSHTAQTLWSAINNPLISPRRFDSVERARIEFDARSCEAARDIYSTEGVLFIQGANARFTAMFSQLTDSLSKWTFWWDLDAMVGSVGEQWLQWLYRLIRQLPPYYGLACSADEYAAKHRAVGSDDIGGATRMVGVSSADFHRFLPGVYWLTIFGAELVDHFGAALQSLPDTRCVTISPSNMAVLLDSPAKPESMAERLRTEARLTETLGADYFFDHTEKDCERTPVPSLAQAMREASA
ncbi:hypothetical protein ACFXI8_26560 [Streptomyces niveus]|uniref:hypothetical protein n=1 Tax=Streptomyces niveus TaxID=193462 RepID=UPI003676E66F